MAGGNRVYWDACNFLYYLNGDPQRLPMLDALLHQSSQGNLTIFTSTISIAEVAFVAAEVLARTLDRRQEQLIDRLWGDRNTIELVEFHRVIGIGARALIRNAMTQRMALTPNDAMHLATAQALGVDELHTYDSKLFKFSALMAVQFMSPRAINSHCRYPSRNSSPLR